MSDQSAIVPPPLSAPGNGPTRDPGQVGKGILLAFLLASGSALLGSFMSGCLGSLVISIMTLMAAVIILSGRGRARTLKGLWIGIAFILGILLIGAASLCGGMFRP